MKHHPSCIPMHRSLIFKCSQCGLEESGDAHLESDDQMERELLRTQEDLLRCLDSKVQLIARINDLELQLQEMGEST